MCVILGAHLLLYSLISVNDNPRSVRVSAEAPGILFFVELPKPTETQPSTHSSSGRPMSAYDPSPTITLPPEIEGTDALIDWDAEASRVAIDAVRRIGEEKKLRSLDQHPAGMGPPPPKSSVHKLGDSQHFEGAAFGQALRLQIPVCTGAGGGKRKTVSNPRGMEERTGKPIGLRCIEVPRP